MNTSNTTSLNPHFSHIYVEKAARAWPDTELVLRRFPKATVIEIEHYKDVFNRPRQEWRDQKASTKLILAVRRGQFLYPGSDILLDYGYSRFFYNTLILNCIYDCDYCYLQGMFPTANCVMFVNNADFEKAVETELEKGPMYLAISYDTDLLAFEHMLPFNKRWIDFAVRHTSLTVESRTKSTNFRAIESIEPVSNVILTWTVSPAEIAARYEKKTPSTASRIAAMKKAVDAGWTVRLCIDPLLWVPDWEQHYGGLIEQVEKQIPLHRFRDITLGVFRMNKSYLKRIRGQRSDTDLLYHDFETTGDVVTYSKNKRDEMTSFMKQQLSGKTEPENIEIW